MNTGEIKLYTPENGFTEVQVRFENETVWLNQEQIATIFGVNRPAITKHLKNIFESGELDEKMVSSILEHTTKHGAIEGKTQINKVKFYNLDAIISIGYRVNSKQATEFRIWATSVLKNYLVNGYALNEKRLREKGYKELENTLELVKKAIVSGDIGKDEALGLLEIITKYTNTWLLLQKYDENDLATSGKTKQLHYRLQAKESFEGLMRLKKELIQNEQASELFAHLRFEGGLEAIFGNIYQTYDKKELYESLEEKAAHLLYFIVKDHPFVDGNKRSGAFLFILFLAKNNILFDQAGERKINDRALVAITLLIAESKPKDKDIMVKLVLNLIN